MAQDSEYSLDTLVTLFADHADKALKENMALKKKMQENDPSFNCDIPFFNLPKALSVMAKEIQTLKTLINRSNI